MDEFKTQSGFERCLDVFKCKISLALKENKEYKTNLYAVIFVDIFIFLGYMYFYYIVGNKLLDELLWSNYDFLVFFFSILTAIKLTFFLL